MKTYLFVLNLCGERRNETISHTENLECLADASVRARKVLKEARRDKVNVLQIDLFEKVDGNFIHEVSYQ